MLDKRALNNEIFPLKGKLGRAKVHVINSLSRKIKKLKLLQEKSPENTKIPKKIENILLEIQTLKKINLRDAAKNSLIDPTNPLETIKSTTCSPEERAIAKLYSHEFVASVVQAVKEKHNLTDENDDWRSFVQEIGNRKKIKIQETKKKLHEIREKQKKLKQQKTKSSKGKKKKRSEIQEWQEQDVEEMSESKVVDTLEKADDPEENKDPFFITQGGDNYQSTFKIDNSVKDEIKEYVPKNRFEKRNGFSKEFPKGGKRKYEPNKHSTKRNIYNNSNSPRNDFNTNKSERSFNKKSENNEDEQLHPSWAAKKKQKITDFQGTKIKFDTEEGGNSSGNYSKTFRHNDNDRFKKSFKTFNGIGSKEASKDQPSLHPSWEAKLKQKSILSEFKGKKTTFDAD